MKKIVKRKQVICERCGTSFSIYLKTYEKLLHESRPILCSIECSNNQEETKDYTIKQETIVDDSKNSFKIHYKQLLQTNPIVRISLSDIEKQWDKQNGLCAITSIPLKLNLNLSSNTIDSSVIIKKEKDKELTKDNIIWVCKPIGLLSNAFNDNIYDILNKIKPCQ